MKTDLTEQDDFYKDFGRLQFHKDKITFDDQRLGSLTVGQVKSVYSHLKKHF